MSEGRETCLKEFAVLLDSASRLDMQLKSIPDIPIPQRLMEQILSFVRELGWELGAGAGLPDQCASTKSARR